MPVLHVAVDDDVIRRLDAVAQKGGCSRSAVIRSLINGGGHGVAAGLEEYERTPELATCAYLPEGRFTVLFREYGAHNPRPEEFTMDGEQGIALAIDTVLMSMYLRYGARYREGATVRRIRDAKRQADTAAGHDSPVPL